MRAKIRLDRESIRKLKSLGLTRRGIAFALSVCERTVTRWVNTEKNVHLRKSTGRPKKVTRVLAEEILNHLSIHPHTTQIELVRTFFLGRHSIHRSTISRFLKLEKWSKKRTVKKQSQVSEEKANLWMRSFVDVTMRDILALDEASFVTTNVAPRYGWSPKGSPCFVKQDIRPPKRERLTLLIAISPESGKAVHSKIFDGSVDGLLFREFIASLPSNVRGKTLLLDNARIHHAKKVCEKVNLPSVKETAEEKGLKLEFLPPPLRGRHNSIQPS